MAVSPLTILACLICFLLNFEPFETHGFSVRLIPIDQFDTKLFPKNLTLEERYQKIFEISRAHVYRLESMVSKNSMDQSESIQPNPNALKPPVSLGIMYYYVTTVSVGTHSYSPNLVVDTSHVDTWMQCEGCSHCFFNREGNFNTSRSQSYKLLPCHDPLCFPHLCRNHNCMYDQTFTGTGFLDSSSKGPVGLDTFTFHGGSIERFPQTAFGCGLENYNLSWERTGQNNNIAGIFGLGLGRRSIFMQYVNETKNRMSYCLPSLQSHTATYLHFGDDAKLPPQTRFSRTRLIPNVTQYAVEVIDISINKKRLKIEPSVFRMRPDHTGGFILDSGIPHTALVRTAYSKVKDEIIKYFHRKYNWYPLPSLPGHFDICYSRPHRNFTLPDMTYHFPRRTILNLPVSNIFGFFDATFCLLIMPINDPGPSKLGALQQVNFRFLFDFTALTVSFAPEICGIN